MMFFLHKIKLPFLFLLEIVSSDRCATLKLCFLHFIPYWSKNVCTLNKHFVTKLPHDSTLQIIFCDRVFAESKILMKIIWNH